MSNGTASEATPHPSWYSELWKSGSALEAIRIERVIALSRLFLTLIVFIAFNVGSIDSQYGTIANVFLVLFTAHSVSAMLVLRSGPRTTRSFAFATHAIDLLAATITLPLAGPTNPFFSFFLFVLAAAAFRWGLRETIVTTVVAVALVLFYARLASTVPAVAALGGPRDFMVVIVQATYLAMMGLLLGYLAEAGRIQRAETDIILNLLGRIRTDSGLTRALTVVARELLTVFGARNILLVLEDSRHQRLVRWDFRDGWNVGPSSAADDPPSRENLRYQFGRDDVAFGIARKGTGRGGTMYRVTAVDAYGRSVQTTGWHVPDAFMSAHPFTRILGAPIRFGDDWVGRVFVIDPAPSATLAPLAQFLQTVVRQVGPALFSVHLLERLRARASAMERARVARELHDGVIQALVGIEMQIDALRSSEIMRGHPSEPDLARVQGLVRNEVLNLRDLMQQLRPAELDPEHLLDHLADMVQRFGRDTGTTARFVTELSDVDLPRRVCFELVRIVQEALVNVRKHAAATNVLVRFGVRDGFWTLEVQDDGRGFPFEGRLSSAELDARYAGPAIIKERVRAIGGRLVIDSTPGRGARLEVLVPQGVRE